MANPNWVRQGASPNPEGRRRMKHSARTIKGMVERFVKRNITTNKLQGLYDILTAKEKLQFLTEVLPYCVPKQATMQMDLSIERLPDSDLDLLYNRVMDGLMINLVPDQLVLPDKIKTELENEPAE